MQGLIVQLVCLFLSVCILERNKIQLELESPTRRDFLVTRDNGTEVSSLSHYKGTMRQKGKKSKKITMFEKQILTIFDFF